MILYPEPFPLLHDSVPAYDFSLDTERIKTDMLGVMKQNNGIGLAANQVNIPYRLFVMIDKIYINPEILEFDKEQVLYKEGCLSFPNLWLSIKRPKNVLVRYQDEKQNYHEHHLEDFHARCFQHELDHLNGICFTYRVSKLKLQMALKRSQR